MAYLTPAQISRLGLKFVGSNVRISDRAAIHNADRLEIGDNSRIDDFCVVSGLVQLGKNVHIAVFCNVAGGTEGIFFGDFSGLAYGCHLFSQSDDYSGKTLTNPTVPDIFKSETKKAISVGRHCIVGTSSIVFPGVNLGEGCAVGALSMVTKSTEEWTVYSGIPAKKIMRRRKDLLELERQYLQELVETSKQPP